MSRLSCLLVAVLVACGGKSTPPPVAPLPEDKPVEEAKPVEPAPPPKEEPPAPAGPLEVKISAAPVTVKLVSAGKGKRAPLVYASKPGAKQQVELVLDFSASQSGPPELGGDQNTSVPTIVLMGDAETTGVDDAGAAYVLSVTGTDARDVPNAGIPLDKLKEALAVMRGMTIGGKLGANGAPAGDVSLTVAQPDEAAARILQIVELTLPSWPVLPTEPVGVGAKWQATSTSKLMGVGDVTVTQVTDYELVSRKGATWTIKGKTKITGKDQELKGSKITAIQGSGTTEATLADGALYPKLVSKTETKFTASAEDKSLTIAQKVGGTVNPKP